MLRVNYDRGNWHDNSPFDGPVIRLKRQVNIINLAFLRYGDLTPITVKGKIHVVIVIIVGLFLTSILAGNLCNLVSTALVDTPPSFAANGKVSRNFWYNSINHLIHAERRMRKRRQRL